VAESIKLGVEVDTDTRATRQEFAALRREVKKEADAMGGDWEAAAQKIEDSLREAGARDDLLDAAKRIGRDGPTEIEKMQRALKDLDDTARETAQDVQQSFEDNALTADDLLGAEVMSEVLQNATEVGAEVVRGFKDGFDTEDVGTILDGLTDTVVSVGALGGPIGIAAGTAAAGAMQGIVGPILEDAERDAERYQETFTNAFGNVVEAGAEAGRELTLKMNVEELVQNADDLARATATANELGIERGVVLRSMAGDEAAYGLVAEATEAALKPYQDRIAEISAAGQEQAGYTQEQTAELYSLTEAMEDITGVTDKSTGAYQTNSDAVNAATEAANAKAEADAWAEDQALANATALAAQTGEAQELETTIGGVSQAIKVMPDGKVIKVSDDGTVKTTQDKITDIRGKDVMVSVHGDTAPLWGAVANFRPPGVEVPIMLRPELVPGYRAP
jgi:hypothetical protein